MKNGTVLINAVIITLILAGSNAAQRAHQDPPVTWKHLSTTTGDIEPPNTGNQQTATAVFDVDKDGVNDFLITERTKAPSVVWYRRGNTGWTKYAVDAKALAIEAGSAVTDIDGDGDLDVVFGGDSQSNKVWWWENPCPDFDPNRPWTRREIKNLGQTKHHDQMFGDFDGDGRQELVFWNQGAGKLYIAEIPDKPREAQTWQYNEIYSYSTDGEMMQRGKYPGFKGINEHEGLAKADIDGDGKEDIVGGGRWFKHVRDTTYVPNIIDASYQFTRAAAGQFIEGGRPEIILVVGDGVAPMMMYEWRKGVWFPKQVIASVDNGHTLATIDFNGDGHLDIFNAEMNLGGRTPDAKTRILLGDGKGNFETIEVTTGIGVHEGKIADLDGDGDLDILGKPYDWQAPRLDLWLNESR